MIKVLDKVKRLSEARRTKALVVDGSTAYIDVTYLLISIHLYSSFPLVYICVACFHAFPALRSVEA
jgi:hypothetical protein